MGTTSANDLSAGSQGSGTNYVYGNNYNGVNYSPTTGINTFALSGSGFYWNGTSNISIIIYWQNTSAPSASSVKYDNTNFVATAYQTFISSWSTEYTNSTRPKLLINGKGLCMSNRVAAVATIQTGSNTYYRDSDGDGFGDETNSIVSCNETPPAGYVTDHSDCNDNLITYLDNDGDGYGFGTPVACGVSNNTDCDDSDNTLWQSGSFYWDEDGDGYSSAGPVIICYGTAPSDGYVTTSLGFDCNDLNAAVYPGSTEICGNGLDDNCNGIVDETCPTPANDNPQYNNPSLNTLAYVYPNCYQVTGTTSGATINSATGEQDVWYQFNALSNGVSIRVTSSQADIKIHLFNANDLSTPLVVENEVQGTGTEILNYGNLIPGAHYRMAISTINQTAGNFTLCIQKLRAPQCGNNTTNLSLCGNFQVTPTAATSITYSFTDESSVTTQTTSSNVLLLNNANLNLRHNSSYLVDLVANYSLVNGAGVAEVIHVNAPNTSCNVSIAQHPLMEVRTNQRCSGGAVLTRSSMLHGQIIGASNVCGATGYRIEFTPVDNCNGDNPQMFEAFSKTVSVLNPYIYLSYAFNQLPTEGYGSTGYWSVRWKPRFNGYEGVYGPAPIIAVNGTAPSGNGMITHNGQSSSTPVTQAALQASIYPNPNSGELVNLNVTGLQSSDVFIRVMDAMGKIIHTERMVAEGSLNTVLHFGQVLPSGMYMVEFTSGSEVITQRMMVAR